MTEYIELNMANYDEDDVAQLNAWGIEAYAEIESLKSENSMLRKAMAVEEDQRVISSGHGFLRVETPGGALLRKSPTDEKVVRLEAKNARLLDLVRYCRATLHEEGLITDQEYVDLLEKGSIDSLHTYDELRAENTRLRESLAKQNEDVCQTLGKALGYPWFKDNQEHFPGATEDDGVCVGDHVAESIADEAARTVKRLKATILDYGNSEDFDGEILEKIEQLEQQVAKYERDHQAMERLRGSELECLAHDLSVHPRKWSAYYYGNDYGARMGVDADPAEAILKAKGKT